jgi:hypothetical protein
MHIYAHSISPGMSGSLPRRIISTFVPPPSLSYYEEHVLENMSKRRRRNTSTTHPNSHNYTRSFSNSHPRFSLRPNPNARSSSKKRLYYHHYVNNKDIMDHAPIHHRSEVDTSNSKSSATTRREQEEERKRKAKYAPFYPFMKSHAESVESTVDPKVRSDTACSIAVTGENPPYWIYVIAFEGIIVDKRTGAEKYNSQTKCGVSKNPFRKHLQRNTKALSRCKYNNDGVGKWVLLTVVGPFENRTVTRGVLRRVRKESRNQYFRPIYTMNMVLKAARNEDYGGRKLVCFARHVSEDVPVDMLVRVPSSCIQRAHAFEIRSVSHGPENGGEIDWEKEKEEENRCRRCA